MPTPTPDRLTDYPIPTPTFEGSSADDSVDTSAIERIQIPSLGLDTVVQYVPYDGFTWMIGGIVLLAAFTSVLTATLTAERVTGTIHGPRDLAGRAVGCQEGTVTIQSVRQRGGIVREFGNVYDALDALALGMVEAVVGENHQLMALVSRQGRGVFPTPQSAYERIATLDPPRALHGRRSHAEFRRRSGRVGREVLRPPLRHPHQGRVGVDRAGPDRRHRPRRHHIPKLIKTLTRLGFKGTLALEYEKDAKDPLPGPAESIGYLRGVIAALA